MTDNYVQATISPELPEGIFAEDELSVLEAACGIEWEKIGDHVYYFAPGSFREEGEGEDGETIDCLGLLQEKLRLLDPEAYPHIVIHGAATCDRMRPDQFGGFAHLITRDRIRSISTWEWLEEQTESAHGAPAPADGTLDTRLLAIIEAILPYAENESHSLYECWRRDGDPQVKESSDACAGAIRQAHVMLGPLRAASEPTSDGPPAGFDAYEIHGVKEYDAGPNGDAKHCEQVDDDDAQFWSLYGHIPGHGAECIGDFKTREHAEEVYARITGRRYGSRS
jgi:hypothetical protein